MNRNFSLYLMLALGATSATFNPSANASLGRVLIVVPSAQELTTQEGKPHTTGYFLSELSTPLKTLINVGYEPTFATIQGEVPKPDPISLDAKWFSSPKAYENAIALIDEQSGLKHPLALESLRPSDLKNFDGIFIPGGHAAMVDLPQSKALGKVLSYFHAANKPTAAICHGPTALLSAQDSQGQWVYAGYQSTVFSTAEEQQEETAGALDGHVLFYPQDVFAAKGGNVQVSAPWTSNAVRDRELITAQNPMSDHALTELFIQALVERTWKVKLNGKTRDIEPASFSRTSDNVTTLFVGLKKGDFAGNFRARLDQHTHLVRQLTGDALLSYEVFSNNGLEIAVMRWKSAKDRDAVFNSVGAQIGADAGEFLESVLFKETTAF